MTGRSLVFPVLLFESQSHRTEKGRTKIVFTDITKFSAEAHSPNKQGQLDVIREGIGMSEISSLTLGMMRDRPAFLSLSTPIMNLSWLAKDWPQALHTFWSLLCMVKWSWKTGQRPHTEYTKYWKSVSKSFSPFGYPHRGNRSKLYTEESKKWTDSTSLKESYC